MCVRHVSVNFNSLASVTFAFGCFNIFYLKSPQYQKFHVCVCVCIYIYVCVCIVAVLLTVSVSVFGAMVSHLDEIFIEGYDHLPYLSWSYWLAVAATLVAWLTAVCFFFVCRLKCSLYTV